MGDFEKGSSAGSGATSAIKRLQREMKEIKKQPSKYWTAEPVNDDLFEWHYTIKGPGGSDFAKGIYHGRIVFPLNYPFAPPQIMLLTPNGRFETNKKICLSISSFHPELWQPAWGVRTIVEALRSFFPSPPEGAVGALNYPSDVRKRIAETETRNWRCPICDMTNQELLPDCDDDEEQNDPALVSCIEVEGEKGKESIDKTARESEKVAEIAVANVTSASDPAESGPEKETPRNAMTSQGTPTKEHTDFSGPTSSPTQKKLENGEKKVSEIESPSQLEETSSSRPRPEQVAEATGLEGTKYTMMSENFDALEVERANASSTQEKSDNLLITPTKKETTQASPSKFSPSAMKIGSLFRGRYEKERMKLPHLEKALQSLRDNDGEESAKIEKAYHRALKEIAASAVPGLGGVGTMGPTSDKDSPEAQIHVIQTLRWEIKKLKPNPEYKKHRGASRFWLQLLDGVLIFLCLHLPYQLFSMWGDPPGSVALNMGDMR